MLKINGKVCLPLLFFFRSMVGTMVHSLLDTDGLLTKGPFSVLFFIDQIYYILNEIHEAALDISLEFQRSNKPLA